MIRELAQLDADTAHHLLGVVFDIDDTVTRGGVLEPEAYAAMHRLAAGGLFPLERLRGNLVGWEDRAQVARAYDQALAFVDHLVERYGEDLVFAMVGACRDGGVEGAAAHFRERTLVDLDQVLGDLADDLQR